MKKKNKNNNLKQKMSQTKCTTCDKTIYLPEGAPINYRDVHNTEVSGFILPKCNYGCEDIKMEEQAHCDPLHGGYFCLGCYERAIEEEKKLCRIM